LDPLKIQWNFEVRTGHPAAELMRAAKTHSADTVVVARRRHGAVGGLAYFSVSAQLFHRWPQTLLVVHPPAGATASSSDSMSAL
jgi:nucleotide-binding universal stress UspA family protein